MPKYIVEGGFNFYEELYKSLDDVIVDTPIQADISIDSQNTTNDYNNVCLISNLPLTDNFVTLECKHKFNYMPLYNDLVNHKKKYNTMERKTLKCTEIICPYCRNIQNKLIPYYDDIVVSKVHGVNHINESTLIMTQFDNVSFKSYIAGNCSHVYLCADGTTMPCKHSMVTLLCDKYYCANHKYFGKMAMLKELKIKEKLELHAKIMEAKKKILEEKKKEKDAAKMVKDEEKKELKKIKEEEKKVKAAAKGTKNAENVIISTPSGCTQLLTTGKNKGKPCCCAKLYQNNLCLRHHNLVNKNNTYDGTGTNYGNPEQAGLWMQWVNGQEPESDPE